MSQVIPLIMIIEGVVIDYRLHFRVLYGEYLQTYKGTDNTISQRIVNAIAMGPNSNLQGGIRYFSLDTGRILQQAWHDIMIYKILVGVLSWINYLAK